jgi:MFS family permease
MTKVPPVAGAPDGKESGWPLWAMLAALTSTFALSQAFRTLPAIVIGAIGTEFSASPQMLGIFAGAFSIAFGAMQLLIGVALDRFGPRRTICILFPLAVAGSALSAFAAGFGTLIAGQILLGISSAPAYISTLVFIVRRYPARRFAALSGITMSLGSLGMLATSTPLAWVVQVLGWRSAFAFLGAASLLSLAACLILLDDRKEDRHGHETLGQAIKGLGPILTMRPTAGILCLGAVLYGAFLAVRTPWIVPLFEMRYGYSLVDAGNVVLIFSFAMVLAPLPFARLDPGGRRRRFVIIGLCYLSALLMAGLGAGGKPNAAFDWLLATALAAVSGCGIFQYADLRSSYPAAVVGRAISLLNTAMFFGVALIQWLTGVVAALADARGLSPIEPVFFTLAILLVAGTTGYWLLPWPKTFDTPESPPP